MQKRHYEFQNWSEFELTSVEQEKKNRSTVIETSSVYELFDLNASCSCVCLLCIATFDLDLVKHDLVQADTPPLSSSLISKTLSIDDGKTNAPYVQDEVWDDSKHSSTILNDLTCLMLLRHCQLLSH